MALATGGFTTYSAIGNREDLTDVIYNISPDDTPLMSIAGRGKAKAVLHEWQTDALDSPVTTNAQLEGDDVTGSSITATTRVQNYCQIFRKDFVVTGTQEAVDKAGRSSEVAYQTALKGRALKTDMESSFSQNAGYVSGGATTARKARALESWLTTNDDRGVSGVDATGADQSPTDSTTLRTLTETILKNVIQLVYTSGGSPSVVMVGPYNKTVISGFTGRTSSREMVDKERIQGAAHLYASDFGDLRIMPSRFQRERTAFVLDPEHVRVSYLRPFFKKDLAITGDSIKKALYAEATLEMCNEAAHGVAADLNTAAT